VIWRQMRCVERTSWIRCAGQSSSSEIADPLQPMIGETISHYRITEKLGAGGMGVVYKALDLELERPVALKFLPNDLAMTDADRERFLREARSASALDHPNIGIIHGIDKTADGHLFIVMAYYAGETLGQKLKDGPPALRQALDWSVQIASGLAATHARNIVHRDIKPSNIIIAENSPRIVDFGLARAIATPSATITGGTTGTLPYMSPEQILGEQVDQRCDVWALSVLMVQMVTGNHPFARDNSTAMTFAILNQPPTGIDALPAVLRPIVLRGLAKDVAHRYLNGQEILSDLERVRAQLLTEGPQLEAPTLTNADAEVALKAVASHASTPRWQTQTTAPQQRHKWTPYLLAALAVVILSAGSLMFAPVRHRVAALLSGSGGESHVAVLPFDNIGNDPANEPVAQGLMDSLTSELSNLDAGQKSLWVVPSSVVRSRKITDPSAAGKELGANLVVKGSIRRDGKIIQLTVNLIDAKDLRQIGSAVLEDRTGDLAGLQQEAVARLARLMNINVTAEALRATGGHASPAAYELYLKALGLMQRYDKPGNLDDAVTALNDAVKADPQFALGYGSLGRAYRLKYQLDPNPKWLEQAVSYCNQAVGIDNHLPDTFVTLGLVHDAGGKYDLAVGEFQHALQLDPRNADALGGLARAYQSAGRLADAEAALNRAIALRPDYWDGYNSLAIFYNGQKKYDLAIKQLKHAVELTPDNAQAYLNLGAVYINTGDPQRFPDAEAALKKSIDLSPTYPAYANLGQLLFRQGRNAESAAATEKALQLNDKNYLVWRNLAEIYLWMKQPDKSATAQDRELVLLEARAKTHTQEARLLSEMATIYAHKNQPEKAQTLLQRALALAPNDSGVLMDAAGVYEAQGNRAKAIQYTQEGLSKGFSMNDLKRWFALQGVMNDPNFRPPMKK
jgi:serine/threonine protein kinase/tetratricopeptide (TPR) repeat protein